MSKKNNNEEPWSRRFGEDENFNNKKQGILLLQIYTSFSDHRAHHLRPLYPHAEEFCLGP